MLFLFWLNEILFYISSLWNWKTVDKTYMRISAASARICLCKKENLLWQLCGHLLTEILRHCKLSLLWTFSANLVRNQCLMLQLASFSLLFSKMMLELTLSANCGSQTRIACNFVWDFRYLHTEKANDTYYTSTCHFKLIFGTNDNSIMTLICWYILVKATLSRCEYCMWWILDEILSLSS